MCLLFTAPLFLFVSHSVSMYLFHIVSESHDSSLLLSLAFVCLSVVDEEPRSLCIGDRKELLEWGSEQLVTQPCSSETMALLGYNCWVFVPIKRRT